jgi:hypothetical protein
MIPYLTVDHVTALSDIGVAGAAVFAAWQGIKSLQIWRNERIGSRKIELAEEALLGIYEVQNALRAIRSPFGHTGESAERQVDDGESPAQKRNRDIGFIAFERSKSHQEKFDKLHILSMRVKAVFGEMHSKPLEDARQTINTIRIAAQSLYEVPYGGFEDREFEKNLESDVWALGSRDLMEGKIGKVILDSVAEAERLFGPSLERS